MQALYSLKHFHPCFEFYNWLAMVKADGATEIVFDIDRPKTNKWPADQVLRRFRSTVEPGPALCGLPYRFGDSGDRLRGQRTGEFADFIRGGHEWSRFRSSVLQSSTAQYTVTLRQSANLSKRNSNVGAWRAFAREIGALVIDDYDVDPMNLHYRMALYAGAEMNFGVLNGPLHLATLSPYPVMMFRGDSQVGHYRLHGLEIGVDPPWYADNQHLIWEPDDLSVIRHHFNQWREKQ